MARPRRTVLEYRSYELPADFPLMVLTGDRWHISPIPGKHLHFHNCLEIGICHTSGGTMLFDRQEVHFSAGDVTCIARNVPHTTWSDPGQGSLWSYVFLDPEALLGREIVTLSGRELPLSDTEVVSRQDEQRRLRALDALLDGAPAAVRHPGGRVFRVGAGRKNKDRPGGLPEHGKSNPVGRKNGLRRQPAYGFAKPYCI